MQYLIDDHREYLLYCETRRGLSQHSIRAYTQDLACYRQWARSCPDDIDSDEESLVGFHHFLRTEAGTSPATCRRRVVTLKAFLKWRSKRDHGRASDFSELDLDLTIPRRLPRPIERPVLTELLASAPHIVPRLLDTSSRREPADPKQTTGLAVRLLIATGLRIGELTALRIRDVLGKGGRLHVRGKGNRERVVFVTNQQLLADLNAYAGARAETAAPDEPLLVNVRGTRLTEAAFRKRLRSASIELDLTSYLTPHQFRHSAATMLIEEGVDIRLVQRLLGHASITTTEIYTKVSDVSLMREVQRADTLSTVESR